MASPAERTRRRRDLNRRLSVRMAQKATKKALSELTPPSQERVRQRGLTTTRPVLKTVADALAFATQPAITFSVTPEGKLETSNILGTARHEVSHFSLPGMKRGRFPTARQTAQQHFSLRAAGAGGETLSVPSGTVLRRAESAARLSVERRIGFALKFAHARGQSPLVSGVTSTFRGKPTSGFQTPHLTKVAETGTVEQSARTRQQMIRLGRRLKSRGIDF